jgi:hypothetical protein
MTRVFLAASFPSGERARDVEPYDAAQIADAVAHISRALLRGDHTLVFGAHPTISPLVLAVASELDARNRVEIHQSRWFEGDIPADTQRLVSKGYGEILWTDAKKSRKASLRAMRKRMLFERPPKVAVFVGGMDGFFEEQQLAAEAGAQCLALEGPGGAARQLAERDDVKLLAGPRYPLLAMAILDAAEQE